VCDTWDQFASPLVCHDGLANFDFTIGQRDLATSRTRYVHVRESNNDAVNASDMSPTQPGSAAEGGCSADSAGWLAMGDDMAYAWEERDCTLVDLRMLA
jgi:hypothetical protein